MAIENLFFNQALTQADLDNEQYVSTVDIANTMPINLAEARDHALSLLQAHVAQLLLNCDEILCDLLISTHSDNEQALYYQSMKVLRANNDSIAGNYSNRIYRLFNKLLMKGRGQSLADISNEKILSHVDNTEIHEYLDIPTIIKNARCNNQDAIEQLKRRLNKLLPDTRITDQNNPLDPALLWNAFQATSVELDINIKAHIILLKQFEREMIGNLAGLYSNINGLLINSGTLPNINFTSAAPVPITLQQTRLSSQLLKDLALKHIFDRSVVSIRDLCESMSLSGPVVEQIIQLLRDEALVELSSAGQYQDELAYRLTDRGRFEARDALSRSGYSGPAPVALEDYINVTEKYSIRKHRITQEQVHKLFTDFVIEAELQDQLGAALNSHRAIFLYGPPGTGKTYTISKLCELYGDSCLIPHAIASGDAIVQVYDPQIHKPLPEPDHRDIPSLRYAEGFDSRYVPCHRPLVVVGGELTLDQLEINYQPETRLYQAPLQLKANNGIFLIDDMGRQAVPPKAIFNRWIVPMEDRRDFLTLNTGQHFEVPFDVQLIFSSNINPYKLADDAFLRRIGFKIMFDHIDDSAYIRIWKQELEKRGLSFDSDIVDYLINTLHKQHNVQLAPCHPRDIINTALSRINYLSSTPELTETLLDWAWNNYFVRLNLRTAENPSDVNASDAAGGHYV